MPSGVLALPQELRLMNYILSSVGSVYAIKSWSGKPSRIPKSYSIVSTGFANRSRACFAWLTAYVPTIVLCKRWPSHEAVIAKKSKGLWKSMKRNGSNLQHDEYAFFLPSTEGTSRDQRRLEVLLKKLGMTVEDYDKARSTASAKQQMFPVKNCGYPSFWLRGRSKTPITTPSLVISGLKACVMFNDEQKNECLRIGLIKQFPNSKFTGPELNLDVDAMDEFDQEEDDHKSEPEEVTSMFHKALIMTDRLLGIEIPQDWVCFFSFFVCFKFVDVCWCLCSLMHIDTYHNHVILK